MSNRTLADHINDKRELNEAFAFWAKELGKTVWHVGADVRNPDRSVYRLMDANEVWTLGIVEKTASRWTFTSNDKIVIRTNKVEMLAVRAI